MSALAVALLLAAACRRPEPVVVHDLAGAAPFAELRSARVVIRGGTLDSELLEERGFERAAGFAADDPFALFRSPATLLVPLGTPAPERLVVDVAPEPGFEGEELEVAVAGTIVGRQRLAPGRQRVTMALPPGLAREGRTRLRLGLAGVREHTRRGALVGRLYGITAGDARDPALDALGEGRIPGLVSAGPGPVLAQVAPSTLRYALELPPHATIAFAVEHDPAAAGSCAPAAVRVGVEPAQGEPRIVWSGTPAAPGQAREVTRALGTTDAGPAWITLEAASPTGCAPGVRWIRPRIAGRAPVPSLHAGPAPETAEVRAARERLRGTAVVLVVLDAAQAAHFGCHGYAKPATPEIDRLAAEGVVFESHYAPAPFTYAAMAEIWTSRPPDEGGPGWLQEGLLPPARLTLAEILSAHGIRTAAFVANPSAGPAFGLERGFGQVELVYRAPWNTGPPPPAEIFARALHPWLATAQPPFFAYAHLREPHMPFGAPLDGPDAPLPPAAKHQDFWDRVNDGERTPTPAELDHLTRLYDGNLRAADRAFGALRARLEALGLWEKSVVIVTADHGEALFEHGHVGHNQQVYEESVHVPLVVRLPGNAGPRGVRRPLLTRHLDLAPTIADLMGVPPPSQADRAFRGRSLLPALLGQEMAPAAAVSRTTGKRPTYAVRAGRHKYILDLTAGREELYDLAADAGERRDLAASSPLVTAVHRQMLARWLTGVRRAPSSAPGAARIDERDREALRALGYIR